jgi:hypothetical protein
LLLCAMLAPNVFCARFGTSSSRRWSLSGSLAMAKSLLCFLMAPESRWTLVSCHTRHRFLP